MSCKIPGPLGTESKFKNKLLEIYNGDESRATEAYSFIRTPDFLENIFGNYSYAIENGAVGVSEEMAKRLDEDTLEPRLDFHEKLQKYYYTDKEGEIVFYPTDRQGLNGFFETNEIKEFAKSLAYNFYDQNLTFDLDTLEFSNNSNENLSDFIERFTFSTGENLFFSEESSLEELSLGGSLMDSVEHIEEWENEVKSILKSFKLDVIAEEISEEEHIKEREEEVNNLMRPESFLVDSKDNVNNNIKLYLSLIERPEKNMFGVNKFVEFGDVYNALNKTLSDLTSTLDENGNPTDLFEIYLGKIKELGNTKPHFGNLYEALTRDGTTQVFKNQIVSAFRLSYNNYLGSEKKINKETGKVSYDVKNLSSVGSKKKQLLDQWQFNFVQKLYDKDRNYISPLSPIKLHATEFSNGKKSITTIEQLMKYVNIFQKDLESLGVKFNSEGKLSDKDTTDKGKKIQKGILLFLDDMEFAGKTLEEKKDELFASYLNIQRGLERIEKGARHNIFKDQATFSRLAEAEAFFQEEGSDASIYTVGKTKWVYSYPSYMSERINTWKTNPNALFKHFMDSEYNRGSMYMKYLLGMDKIDVNPNMEEAEWEENYKEEAIKNIEELELFNFNSVQNKGDAKNAADTTEIKENDAVIDYANKVLAFKKGGVVYNKTALAADKTTELQLRYGNALVVNSKVTRYDEATKQYNFSNEVLDIFYNYFKSDYKRMSQVMDEINTQEDKNLRGNYHLGTKNGLMSQLFPFMSISIDKDGNAVLPEDKELHDLYDPITGEAHLTNLDIHKDLIKDKIKTKLSENIKDMHEQLIEDSLFEYNLKGELVNKGLDSVIFDTYKKEEAYDGMATETLTADFLINSLVSQVEYSKMFSGDTAYYKNMADYKKRVPATYTDGLYLNISEAKDKFFNVAVVSSIEVGAPYFEELTKLLGDDAEGIANKYYSKGKINAADAQAWITPERWAFIKKGLGKWNSAHDVLVAKMNDPHSTFTPKELKMLAQPLKGVYFDIVEGVPVFLKYSQAVLAPRLINNAPLQKLYDKMTKDANGNEIKYEDQIHEVVTRDGIKTGYNTPVDIHDENGDMLEDFDLTPIALTNAGWKLQQDLSPKGVKSTEVGSQTMKVIFQGLSHNLNKEFYLSDGTVMKGSELIQQIHDVVSTLSDKGTEKLLKKLGVNPDTFEIENEEVMYSSMIDDLAKRKDTPDNIIKGLMAGLSPFALTGQYQIFQNVFSSAVNKATVKVRTNGGSFIQMSDFGISKTEASKENRGIRFAPWFKDKQNKLHTPEPYTDEEGRKRVRPGGVFITGSFIAKYVPDYRDLTDEQLFGVYNVSTGKYEGGLIDERILKNIVGYRIPNQGLPSNDAFHVMGLLPEDSADTIIAYTGITTKTGSDFDIDKMYIMMPNFRPQSNIKSEVYKQVISEFRGETIRKTIDNLKSFVEETTGNYFDIDDIAAYMHDNTSRLELKKEVEQMVTEILSNSKNETNEKVKTIRDKFDVKITRLQYVTPYKVDKDTEAPLHEQPEEVLQNKLIESYAAVLASTHTIQDVMKPIDEPFIEKDVKNIHPEEKRNDMMEFDAISDVRLKQQFKLGKAGLGQTVNSLVDSGFGSMAYMYLLNYNVGRGNETKEGDTLFDRKNSEKLSEDDIREYVEDFNSREDEPTSYEEVERLSEIKLDDSMKALSNGFVDVAKDPFITRANWVTQTNNMGLLLVRAGVHPFYINAFIGQPILKEYIKFQNINESTSVNNKENIKERFLINKIVDKFTKDNKEYENSFIELDKFKASYDGMLKKVFKPWMYNKSVVFAKQGKYFDPVVLKRELKKELYTELQIEKYHSEDILLQDDLNTMLDAFVETADPIMDYMIGDTTPNPLKDFSLARLRGEIENNDLAQMAVLRKYFDLIPIAKNLGRSVKGSKFSTDGKGKNITSLIMMNNFIRDIYAEEAEGNDGALMGFGGKLKRNGKDTFLNTMFKNSILTPYKIMRANPKYFFIASDQVISSFNYISYSERNTRLQNEDVADELEKSYYSYIMSGFAPLQSSKEEKIKLFKEMPEIITELKEHPILKKNLLVQQLTVKEGELYDYLSMSNAKKSTNTKNALTDAWRHLLEVEPKLGEDLVKYSFYISGFNISMNQFHEFIPYEWYNKNRFNSYLKGQIYNMKDPIDRNFIDQFYRGKSDINSGYAHQVSDSETIKVPNVDKEDGFGITIKRGKVARHYVFTPIKESTDSFSYNPMFLEQEEATTEKEDYYKFTGRIGETGYYIKTSPLGHSDSEGNKIVDFDKNHKFSDVSESNSMVSDIDMTRPSVAAATLSDMGVTFYVNDKIYVNPSDTEDVTKLLRTDPIIENTDESQDPLQDPCK